MTDQSPTAYVITSKKRVSETGLATVLRQAASLEHLVCIGRTANYRDMYVMHKWLRAYYPSMVAHMLLWTWKLGLTSRLLYIPAHPEYALYTLCLLLLGLYSAMYVSILDKSYRHTRRDLCIFVQPVEPPLEVIRAMVHPTTTVIYIDIQDYVLIAP